MTHLPLRVRLAASAAAALALVLAALGVLVYVLVGDALRSQVDEALESRAGALARGVQEGRTPAVAGDEDDFTQVLSPQGALLAGTPGVRLAELPPALVAQARARPVLLDTYVSGPDEEEREPARVLMAPAGDRLVLVGASVEDREDALAGVLGALLMAAPLAAAAAGGGGYVLAGAALRPVEAMRQRAAQVTAATPGERLPLPVARDELRRLGSTLNAMLDRLDDGLLRERRFVADASHELRTPLAALQVELELALRRPRTVEELTTALRAAAEDVQRLIGLAEDLLVLASAGRSGAALQRDPVSVRALVDGAAARAAGRAGTLGREVHAGERSDAVVGVDRRRLDRALDALVDNALRHGAGRVQVAGVVTDDALVLTVTDEGPGLPEQFVPRAFERFSQADAARSSGGAGLGLALVREVALSHGGDARVAGPARVDLVVPLGAGF